MDDNVQTKIGGKRKLEEDASHPSRDFVQDSSDGQPKRKRRKKAPVANTKLPD